jgi:hypothetical protein
MTLKKVVENLISTINRKNGSTNRGGMLSAPGHPAMNFPAKPILSQICV